MHRHQVTWGEFRFCLLTPELLPLVAYQSSPDGTALPRNKHTGPNNEKRQVWLLYCNSRIEWYWPLACISIWSLLSPYFGWSSSRRWIDIHGWPINCPYSIRQFSKQPKFKMLTWNGWIYHNFADISLKTFIVLKCQDCSIIHEYAHHWAHH